MSAVFIKLLNLSITATWLILAVIFLRIAIRKSPKWINCLLWGLVAVRLLCPFSIESVLSLIPSGKTVPENIEMMNTPAIDSGIGFVDKTINTAVMQNFTPNAAESINPLQIWMPILSVIWLMGTAVLLLYAFVSYLKIKKSVSASICVKDNVMICDEAKSPFILGIFKPKIYLPSFMDIKTRDYVIVHEKAHIKRHDQFWKPIGYLLLAVYWFNPFCWAAYSLFCRDIEMACDEKVVADLSDNQRADYSEALLRCSFPRRKISASPLAFGEVGVKKRIKSVLNYKKPTFWIILAAVISCVVIVLCFLTDPYSNRISAVTMTKGDHTHTADAKEAYLSFLVGDRTLLDDTQSEKWDIPDFNAKEFQYEYLLRDLDNDGLPELIVQMKNDPRGYNGVFHYAAGKIVCWQSDTIEMSCRDYPLKDGTMVRQYDHNGSSTYTVFCYNSDGTARQLSTLFKREESIYDDGLPCPYYEADGKEISQTEFNNLLCERITDKLLNSTSWQETGN